MPDSINIYVRLKDAASKQIDVLNKNIGGIGGVATKALAPLKGMFVQLAAIAGIFQGGRFIGDAIKTFKDFDDTMRQVGAVTGAVGEEFQMLTDLAKRMGAETRYSAAQAADGLRLLGMAGFEAAEAAQALPDVLELAAAGSLDLGTAADITTNILAGFGLEADKLGRVNDVLVKTFTSSNTTLQELGESFKLVGPIAKGIGANFEDLLASIGRLGDAGLKGTLAGTALRGALNALFNPTKEEANLMNELAGRIGQTELNIKDASGNFIGFAGIIEQLEKAGLKGEEALALFGQRAGPGMAALLQVGSKKLGEFKDQLDGVGDISKEIADRMEAGIGGASRRLAASFENLKITFGEAFNRSLINSIYAVKDAVDAFSEVVAKANDQTTTLNGTLLVLSTTFKVIAYLVRTVWYAFRYLAAAVNEALKYLIAFSLAATGQFAAAREALADVGNDLKDVWLDAGNFAKKGAEDLGKELEKGAEGPIGAGVDEITAKFRKGLFEIDELYKKDKNIEKYFAKRKELIQAKYAEEIGILKDKLKETKKVEDQRKIENQILIKEIELQTEINQLEVDKQNKIRLATQARLDQLNVASQVALVKTKADLDKELTIIEGDYERKKLSLNKYFDGRKSIIERRIKAELDVLRSTTFEDESDPDKKAKKQAILNAEIYAKEKELQTKLVDLDNERLAEIKSNSDDELRDRQKLNDLKLKAEKVYNDQLLRIKQFESNNDLDVQFQEELLRLQQQQQNELDVINDFNNEKLDQLRKLYASEEELTRISEENKLAIKKQKALQELEIKKLIEDQNERARINELQNLSKIAGGTATVFNDLYELLGSKNKELFQASKAAALAESFINTALAVTAALKNPGGYAGIALAAVVAAKGAIESAKIAKQGFFAGGVVPGTSPTPVADDKTVRVTSGEFIEPVGAIGHYGKPGLNFLEAFRTKSLPKNFFDTFKNFKSPGVSNRTGYAEGGIVSGERSNTFSVSVPIEINGYENKGLANRLRTEIEQLTIKIMREELR